MPGRVRVRRDRGVVSVEAAIVVPALLLFIVFAVAAGWYATAKQNVVTAADAAARAASISRTPAAARAAAASVAQATLDQKSMHCTAQTDTDTSGFSTRPGQSATVSSTVTCRLDFTGLPLPGLHSVTLRRTATSPLDVYRER